MCRGLQKALTEGLWLQVQPDQVSPITATGVFLVGKPVFFLLRCRVFVATWVPRQPWNLFTWEKARPFLKGEGC